MFVLDWKIIAALAATLSVIGLGFYVDGLQNKVKSQRDTIVELRTTIRLLSAPKNTQIKVTERGVTKVIQGKDTVRTIIKEVNSLPEPPNCVTPPTSESVRNMM